MLGRLYVAQFENVSVSATQDLFEIQPASANPIVIHSLMLYNVGADVGDAQEEMLRLTIRWLGGTLTGGSGGSAATAYQAAQRFASPGSSSSAAVEVNNTSKATTTGSNLVLAVGGWNIRMPYERIWTPEARILAAYDWDNVAASALVVRLENSPADAISMSGELVFEEIGN